MKNEGSTQSPVFQFPIPLDRIANEFHISVDEVRQFLEELDTPIGNVCGRPAIEPHYYLLAFRKTCVAAKREITPPGPTTSERPTTSEPKEDQHLIRHTDAAKMIGVLSRTVCSWVSADPPRMFPTKTIGNFHYFTEDEVLRMKEINSKKSR